MVRPLNVRKGSWTKEEDADAYVSKHRTGNSTAVSKKSGLGRCGKSCRHKCSTHLRPGLGHQSFTPQEEELVINLHATIGSRWSIIAQQLPGRTDNDVKNYWNTKLKKKLCEMGIDHVTHKPFSQIIADYSSIGAFPKPSTQIRDFSSTFIHKTEQSPLVQVSNLNTTNLSPESFLSNNYTNNSEALDLLTQLQAITLVTQAPNCPNHDIINQPQFCINEYSSSSSSSSPPPPSIANEGWLPTSFSWRDFLLEDAIPPQNGVQQENSEEVSLKGSSSQVGIDIKLQTDMNKGVNDIPMINSFKGSAFSADSSSFVEAILEGEQDMFWEFPGLLEEPFFY